MIPDINGIVWCRVGLAFFTGA